MTIVQCRSAQIIPILSSYMFTGKLGTQPGGGGVGTPYNGLYGEAPLERGTFFRLQVYKRVRISQVWVYERLGKSSFGY